MADRTYTDLTPRYSCLMPRPEIDEIMDSIVNLLETIDVGNGDRMAVGDGTDPNHEYPYLVVGHVSSQEIEGSFAEDDQDADESLRIQITGVGSTRKQSDWARAKARETLTKSALTDQFSTDSLARACMRCELDLSLSTRYERGVSEAVFVGLDQYIVKTTPS